MCLRPMMGKFEIRIQQYHRCRASNHLIDVGLKWQQKTKVRLQIPTYLFELLDVDVQLAPKLGFRLRKRIDLCSESPRSRGFVFRQFPLMLVTRDIEMHFAFFGFHQRLKMKLA